MSKYFVDWFSQQEEFTTDIEEMNKEELKQDGGYYNKATLTSIRAAIDRHLCNEPHNKPFSIISDSQFTEVNKALNSFLKTLSKSGQICSTVHKPALTTEAVSKLYEAGELVDERCHDPQKLQLQQTAWFFRTSTLVEEEGKTSVN